MQPLLGDPRSALAAADVAEALSLARGARVRHGVDVLDRTDTPTGQVLRFRPAGSQVSWTYRAPDRVVGQSSDVAAVRRQATLVVDADQAVNLQAVRLRLWTELQMRTGAWARFYLGVFVVVNPGGITDDGVQATRTLQLADKSYLWANTFLTEPVSFSTGDVVLTYIKNDLAARFGETRFAFPASTAALAAGRTFEAGQSWLAVYSSLCEAIGFDQVIADEQGRATAVPLTDLAGKGVEAVYGAGAGKVVSAGQVDPLLPTLPNVVRFSARQGPSLGNIEGNGLRTVLNQSTGPASIDGRGGVRVELRVDVDADSQPELDAVAHADAQRYFAGGGLRWSGKVGLQPRHSDRDVIGLQLPRLGLTTTDGWLVTSWTYPLGDLRGEQDVLMPITAERRVAL